MLVVQVRCDKSGCKAVYELKNRLTVDALFGARDAGWKVNTASMKAKCPDHRDSGGARLKTLGAGAL
jgi:hypothetical protein